MMGHPQPTTLMSGIRFVLRIVKSSRRKVGARIVKQASGQVEGRVLQMIMMGEPR
jgi:hypothetical protein